MADALPDRLEQRRLDRDGAEDRIAIPHLLAAEVNFAFAGDLAVEVVLAFARRAFFLDALRGRLQFAELLAVEHAAENQEPVGVELIDLLLRDHECLEFSILKILYGMNFML